MARWCSRAAREDSHAVRLDKSQRPNPTREQDIRGRGAWLYGVWLSLAQLESKSSWQAWTRQGTASILLSPMFSKDGCFRLCTILGSDMAASVQPNGIKN